MSYGDWIRYLQISGVLTQMQALANQAAEVAARAPATATMDLAGYSLGVIVASQPIMKAVTAQALTLPKGLAGSYAYCDVAPTADVVCPINRVSGGVVTQIGSVTFLAGTTIGAFAFDSDVTTLPGDVIAILAPATVDASFAGPAFGLAGSVSVAVGYVATKLAAYTPAAQDRDGLIVMNAGSAVVNALPAATGSTGVFPNGWRTSFLNVGANAVTLAAPSGAYLNGKQNGTFVLASGQGAQVRTDGVNWFVMLGA
jgi:hypothetical protein